MEFLYDITILPIELLLKYAYLYFSKNAGGYFLGLIWLSLLTSLIMVPLKKLVQKLGRQEELLQNIIQPQLEQIRKNFSGEDQHRRIQKLYTTYGYHPILAIRSMLGLFIQVPFLMAAFYMLDGLIEIRGESFGMLLNLAQPDQLWRSSLGAAVSQTYKVNALPFVMTFINLLAILSSTSLNLKKLLQGVTLAGLFLLLLYDAPAALLIFWTSNNLISLVINLYKISNSGSSILSAVAHNLKILPRALRGLRLHLWVWGPSFYVAMFFILLQHWADRQEVTRIYPILLISLLAVAVQAFRGFRIKKCASNLPELFSKNLFRLACLAISFGAFIFVTEWHLLYISAAAILLSLCLPASLAFSFGSIKSFALPLLAVLAVFVFYASGNHEVINLSALFQIFVVAIALLAFIAILSFFVASKIPETVNAQELSILLVCMVLSWGFFPAFIRAFSIHRPQPIFFLVYFLLQVLMLYSIAEKRPRLVAPFLLAFTLASPFVFDVWGHFSPQNSSTNKEIFFALNDEMKNLRWEEKNSVYLLVYDGVPQPELFEELKLDFTPIGSLLSSNSFKVYEETYSLGRMSKLSMSAVFNFSPIISEGQFQSMSMAGMGRFWQIMKQNSYTSVNIQAPMMTDKFKFTDYLAPLRAGIAHDYSEAHDLLLSVFLWEFRFNLMSPFGVPLNYGPEADRIFNKAHSEHLTRDLGPKVFASHAFTPGHTNNTGKCLKNERESYQLRVEHAAEMMEQNIRSILSSDPSAIIVVLSDHGAQLAGDCSIELFNYKADEVTERMFWDRFGTLLAVRWPDRIRASQYDADLRLIQDIGPTILAYLSNSKEPLKWKPRRNITYKGKDFLRQGVLTLPSEVEE